MTSRYVFAMRGRSKAKKPWHFIGCGLPNVYLESGFEHESDPDYGDLVTIDRLPELFMAIAFTLTKKPAALTGAEFRFLRKRMEKSQAQLATELAVNEQTVANYEKESTKPGAADIAIRLLYLAYVSDDDDIAQELRFEAEDLMKPSRRGKPEPATAGPWINRSDTR